jgi:hypothetical protein
VTGRIVPEPVRSPSQYRREILGRIYRDLKPHDPDGTLRHEWANARGAIARFERNTLEIRVLDIQECPRADLAIVRLIVAVLRLLTGESLSSWTSQLAPETAALQGVLRRTAAQGGDATIRLRPLLRALGCSARSMTGAEVWRHLMEATGSRRADWRGPIDVILSEGCLGARLVRAAGPRPGRRRLRSVYRRLADCLDRGGQFHA